MIRTAMLRTAFCSPSIARTLRIGSSLIPSTRASPASYSHPQRRPRVMASTKTPAPQPEAFAPTIFDKILAKEIPADIVYEDDDVLAFHDVNPQAPVHVLLIPKRRIPMLSMAEESDKEILGTLLLKADVVAQKVGLANGYRILINNGKEGLQSVFHIHLHIVGGRTLKWGPF